jgi:serine/threonine protein kinase/Tol biopolymer transport system component
MIGQTISHYRIVEKLGEGGMGVVYRAEDTRLDRTVALKFLSAHLLQSSEARERFVHEAKAAAALDHPNICTVYEIDEAEGQTYLSMAFLEGRTLQQTIAERPLKLERALESAIQIAQGLAAAHERGINHRDIKPANLMLGSDGTLKIMDFGLAYLGGKSRITKTGTILGTPSYMAPEQIRGEQTDSRADIWSFGVVLQEMITGRPPFEAETEQGISYAILHQDPEPLTALRSGVPVELDRIVAKCLAKDPGERYQHIDDALVDLRTQRKLLPATTSRRTTAVQPSRRPRALWLALAALPLLAAAFALVRLSMEAEPAASHRFLPFATEEYGESQPLWSPDGRTIAYVATINGKDQILVRDPSAASPFSIAKCPAICDVVGWSGDGSRVYYQSRTTHLDARLWSAGSSGGEPAPVFQEDFAVLASAVSPDGKRLAMIRVFLTDDGARKARLFLSEPPGAAPVSFEAFPAVSLVQFHSMAWFADSDRLLIFSPAVGNKVFLASASQKTLRQVAEGVPYLLGLTWSRDPLFALAAVRTPQQGAGGLYWLQTEAGALSPFRLSELRLSRPAVSPDGSRLAYTVAETDLDIVEIPLDGSPVRPLVATRLIEQSARYSPLSDEFAYVTRGEIRIRQSRSLAERTVVSDASFPAGEGDRADLRSPAFSSDGARIAYNKRFRIWISPANGGQATPLNSTAGEFGAEWSPDGAWIAYNWARPQESGLFKQRVGSSEAAVRLTEEMCGVGPAWSPDGAWIACSMSAAGMSLVPADGGPPKALGQGYGPWGVWSRDGELLYVVRVQGDLRELGALRWRTGTFQPLNRLPPSLVILEREMHGGRMSLSYDGRSLIATAERATGDIWILDGFRPPRPFWKRMFGLD